MQSYRRLLLALLLLGGCTASKKAQQAANNSNTTLAKVDSTAKDEADPEITEAPAQQPARVDSTPAWAPKVYHYNPSRTLFSDLQHTELHVSFDFAKRHLLGQAILTLKPHFHPTDSLTLDAVGFQLKRVALALKGKAVKDLVYSYDSTQLKLKLDRLYSPQENYQLYLEYVARPDEVKSKGGSAAITGDKGLYFINPDGKDSLKPRQVWTQGETQSNSHWFPTIDAPNVRTTQEMYITVADSFTTLSNGKLVSQQKNSDGTRTDVWRQEPAHAPYLFMMAVGKFTITKDSWRGKEVNYYTEPAYAPYAKLVFGHTPEMLEFFSNRLGVQYPWVKYSQVVVRDFVSGAMENTTATLHYDKLQHDTRAHKDETQESVIAHELFHQWFGDYVTTESWANLPLNESFATYGEYLWDEHKYGTEEADRNLDEKLQEYLAEAENKREPLIRYYYHDREDMFDAHTYQKGGRVLHMLRNTVGDDAFFASLQTYLTKNALTSVEIDKLRLAFEEITGEDMHWFFDQWFLKPGHPSLQVSYAYSDSTHQALIRITQTQRLDYQPIYRLPARIEVHAGGTSTLHPIVLTSKDTIFHIPCSTPPDYVDFDADKVLLAQVIEKGKDLSDYEAQLKYSKRYKQKQLALANLAPLLANDTALAAVLAATHDPFWGTRADALDVLSEAQTQASPSRLVVERIFQLADAEPKSSVRKDALEYLAGLYQRLNSNGPDTTHLLDLPQLQHVFEKASQDSSYAVTAAGLQGLYLTSRSKGMQALRPAMSLPSDEVKAVVAAILMREQAPEAADYTLRTLQRMGTGGSRFQLFTGLGAYAPRQDDATQARILTYLKQVATTDATWYMRLAAARGLYFSRGREDVQQFLNDLKKNEPNAQLREFYEREIP